MTESGQETHPCQTWLLDPHRCSYLRRPIARPRAPPHTLQSQRDLQTRVSPQKSSTVEAVGEQIKTMVENGKACDARITGVSAGSYEDDVWERRSRARWSRRTPGARSRVLRL